MTNREMVSQIIYQIGEDPLGVFIIERMIGLDIEKETREGKMDLLLRAMPPRDISMLHKAVCDSRIFSIY